MMQKNTKLIIAGIFVLLAAGAGVGIWFFEKQNKQIFSPPAVITPRPQEVNSKIYARTDKGLYRSKDEISVTLQNDSARDVYSMATSQTPIMGQTLYLRVGQEWQIVTTEAPCPGCQLELAPLSILGPGKSAAYIWEPLYYDYAQRKMVALGKGLYRLGITYQYELGEEPFEAITNEFEITE